MPSRFINLIGWLFNFACKAGTCYIRALIPGLKKKENANLWPSSTMRLFSQQKEGFISNLKVMEFFYKYNFHISFSHIILLCAYAQKKSRVFYFYILCGNIIIFKLYGKIQSIKGATIIDSTRLRICMYKAPHYIIS